MEAFRDLYMGEWKITKARCDRKRARTRGYPQSSDRCPSVATHRIITASGREQHACAPCVAAFTSNMVKGEEIHIVKL